MRLRSALEIQHWAVFFCANALFQIKTNPDMTAPDSDEFADLEKRETEAYEHAKAIRHEILSEAFGKADDMMKTIARRADDKDFVQIPGLAITLPEGAPEIQRILEQCLMLGKALDLQGQQIVQWRNKVVALLLQPLVDVDDGAEITGDGKSVYDIPSISTHHDRVRNFDQDSRGGHDLRANPPSYSG